MSGSDPEKADLPSLRPRPRAGEMAGEVSSAGHNSLRGLVLPRVTQRDARRLFSFSAALPYTDFLSFVRSY